MKVIDYLRKLKCLLDVLWASLMSVAENVILLSHGQNKEDEVLQLAHRLEKGMCIAEPRALWGWDKATWLASKCSKLTPSFARETGLAVLAAYLNQKENESSEDKKRAKSFKEKYDDMLKEAEPSKGGRVFLTNDELSVNIEAVEQLFRTRHSIRDFDGSPVSTENLMKAIDLANRCPSACNRQVSRVYVIPNDVWIKFTNDPNQVYNASSHLLVTAERTAYVLDEIQDWLVSGSMYAAYLTLALSTYGIASCVIRKSPLNDKSHRELKKYCGIPSTEKIMALHKNA